MQFIKLEILNLASLDRDEGEVINFEEGVLKNSTIFSIVGPTGSGKSTILDAICLALYNRAPRYPMSKGDRNQKIEVFGEADEEESHRIAPTDCRNILTRGKKRGYSKLTFLANSGQLYRAEWSVTFKRVRHDKAVTALYKLGVRDGEPYEEVAEWSELPQIIGLEYNQFLRTVLIAQGSFSEFLTAKESERYELLEKLVGNEEMYTAIATKIKASKDQAVDRYKEIDVKVSAYKESIIPDDQLEQLNQRIKELQVKDEQVKDELTKVNLALEWYRVAVEMEQSVAKAELAKNQATEALESAKGDIESLALYNSTQQARDLFRDICSVTDNIKQIGEQIAAWTQLIEQQSVEITIKDEAFKSLEKCRDAAAQLFENEKPRIERAKTIKAELIAAELSAKEKKSASDVSQVAHKKAQQEVDENVKAIASAEQSLDTVKKDLEELQVSVDKELERYNDLVKRAVEEFERENKKIATADALVLQNDVEIAKDCFRDLQDVVRVLTQLKSEQRSFQDNALLYNELTERNAVIKEQLSGLNIQDVEKNLDALNQTFNLMTSSEWEVHRASLQDDKPCPLCGATDHPYKSDSVTFSAAVAELQKLKDETERRVSSLRERQNNLNKELGVNSGKVDTIEKGQASLKIKIEDLELQSVVIFDRHENWAKEIDALNELKPSIEMQIQKANAALKAYNETLQLVNKLRTEKERVESAKVKFVEESAKRIEEFKTRVTNAHTLLETERSKSKTLKGVESEKATAYKDSVNAYNVALKVVLEKREALKNEIGDKDPAKYEADLTQSVTEATGAVGKAQEELNKLRLESNKRLGECNTMRLNLKSENDKLDNSRNLLTEWIVRYNSENDAQITNETIAQLAASGNDWQAIRNREKSLRDGMTVAVTTLQNCKNELARHNEKRPEKGSEELVQRKVELAAYSNEELTLASAKLKLHNESKEKMGALYAELQQAEQYKRDWEQINDSIGGDGKTLRMIAQCYTLRFLVEYANVEIRKFNQRFELQQVKNSLGLRVIDHDRADDVRDITSLSGGETFIVSLGLALGLSAISSRNVACSNLFIDEGFGTLDPDSLATVIDSLSTLQSSQGKKVGVISHTDTMSERITTQIRIIKSGNSGSSRLEVHA